MEQTRFTSSTNRLPWWLRLLMAASAAWAISFACGLPAANRGAGVVDVVIVAALNLFFSLYGRTMFTRGVRIRAALVAAAFVLTVAACEGWLSALRYEHFTDPPLYVCYYLNALIGLILLLACGLSLLLQRWMRLELCARAVPANAAARAKRTFILAFVACVLVYMLFLLNQYPGSMESDHMRQLKSVLEARFDNRNPLVNSLLVLGCVRLAQLFGGSMNAGVFLYSVVQLSLMAAVFAYGVSLTARAGFSRRVAIVALLFYALVPYNIFYSYGMWKDAFFAAWLLLTLFAFWHILILHKAGQRVGMPRYALLAFAALMASLSRNSGWSALLLWLPCLVLMLRKLPVRKGVVCAVSSGVALALLIMGPVYSAFGVDKTADSITVSCIPLQQVGAVLAAEKPLATDQQALIERLVDPDEVRAQYDPACADPMKDLLYPRIAELDANLGAYVRLWLTLGVTYPATYFRAYLAQIRMYVDPNVSSETAYKWIYPNDFGVYRDSKLLPGIDLGYYENWLELPALNLLKRPGAILWSMVVLWQLCALRGNRQARLLILPLLFIYLGLFLTVPVALFRYIYSVAACIPLLFLWPFYHQEGNLS